RLKFSGHFDEAAFRRAVRRTLARHPLFCARVVGPTRHAEWIPNEDDVYLDIADLDTVLRFPGSEQIDIRKENGLRIWVRTGKDWTEMRVQYQHCTTDGIGSYRFLEDLLCAYDAEACGRDTVSSWRAVRTDKLPDRARLGLNWWRLLMRLPLEIWGIIAGLVTFFLLRPTPLKTPEIPIETTAERLVLLDYPTHTFSLEETKQIRDAARRQRVTLNDLMLRDLFVAMDAWNELHSTGKSGRLMRVMSPVSLRVPGDEDLPATNVVAMVFVDRHLGIYRNRRILLSSINWEMWYLKTWRLGVAFVRCVGLFGLFPRGMELLSRSNRCYATAVLSNMGQGLIETQLPRVDGKIIAGDLVLEALESAPPVRAFTSIGLTFVTYAGRLAMIMNYDRLHFSAPTAQQLLNRYIAQIRAAAGIAEPAPTEHVKVSAG
ncbi:MAG TPA: hypothetical protein VGJ26_03040, partial [Pirellulales bacterium]